MIFLMALSWIHIYIQAVMTAEGLTSLLISVKIQACRQSHQVYFAKDRKRSVMPGTLALAHATLLGSGWLC